MVGNSRTLADFGTHLTLPNVKWAARIVPYRLQTVDILVGRWHLHGHPCRGMWRLWTEIRGFMCQPWLSWLSHYSTLNSWLCSSTSHIKCCIVHLLNYTTYNNVGPTADLACTSACQKRQGHCTLHKWFFFWNIMLHNCSVHLHLRNNIHSMLHSSSTHVA